MYFQWVLFPTNIFATKIVYHQCFSTNGVYHKPFSCAYYLQPMFFQHVMFIVNIFLTSFFFHRAISNHCSPLTFFCKYCLLLTFFCEYCSSSMFFLWVSFFYSLSTRFSWLATSTSTITLLWGGTILKKLMLLFSAGSKDGNPLFGVCIHSAGNSSGCLNF